MNTVVIVEDSHVMHQIYRAALTNSSFKIVGEAMDGKMALTVIQRHQPSIVILDLVIPELSGIDVLKQLSQISPNSKTIVITSVEDSKILQQVKNLGAVFVLQKPFKKDQLLHTLSLLAEPKIEVKHG